MDKKTRLQRRCLEDMFNKVNPQQFEEARRQQKYVAYSRVYAVALRVMDHMKPGDDPLVVQRGAYLRVHYCDDHTRVHLLLHNARPRKFVKQVINRGKSIADIDIVMALGDNHEDMSAAARRSMRLYASTIPGSDFWSNFPRIKHKNEYTIQGGCLDLQFDDGKPVINIFGKSGYYGCPNHQTIVDTLRSIGLNARLDESRKDFRVWGCYFDP